LRKFPFCAALACLSLLLTSTAQAKQTFTISHGKSEFSHIDIGTPGMSIGDKFTFEAPFTTKDGKMGRMYGVLTLASIPTGPNDPFIDRIGMIVFDFGGSDTLVISGKSAYGSYKGELKDNEPVLRAVTGGTGKFIGARGQISSTRDPSGSYEHAIQLLD